MKLYFYFLYYLILFISVVKSQNSTSNNSTSTTIITTTTTTTTTKISTLTTSSSTTNEPTTSKSIATKGCILSQASKYEMSLLEKIKPLFGDKFRWNDTDHLYYFTICNQADYAKNEDEGFIQKNSENGNLFVLGRLNDVDLEGLEAPMTVVRLVYNNGDKYANACKRSERKTVVYIGCSVETKFRMIEENNERDNDNCAYVFELMTPKICNNESIRYCENCNDPKSSTASPKNNSSSSKSGFGIFSIIIISIVSLLVVYLVIGTIYLRFLRNARGWEQVPNFRLWNTIGNKMADCCNYVCRCGQRPTEIHSYDNINDRMSDDDNLLNF